MMNVRIENGVTIISTGDAVGGIKNKTGHTGITYYDKKKCYSADISIKKVKYFLGFFKNIEDAVAIRKEAELQKANGTFLEWYDETKKKRA